MSNLQSPDTFSICYKCTAVKPTSDAIEKNMLIALKKDKQLINNKIIYFYKVYNE